MLRETKGPICALSQPNFTYGLCFYCHSLALPHMMVRRPLYVADVLKSSKWRDRHKPTLIPAFLTSPTCNHHVLPPGPGLSSEPLCSRFQPRGRWSEHRSFPLPIQRMRPRQKKCSPSKGFTDFLIYPHFALNSASKSSRQVFKNANET